MTKSDLILEMSGATGLKREESEQAVKAIFDKILQSVRAGNRVEIRGFGTFRNRMRKPRVIRNPRKRVQTAVPLKSIPYFAPSKALKHFVNDLRTGARPIPRHRSPKPKSG